MSTRTRLTILDQAGLTEDGPATKTAENSDVANGNKVRGEPNVVVFVDNTTAGALNITYTYDERGQTRTKVISAPANAKFPIGPFDPVLLAHAGDLDGENGQDVWLTAAGTAGQIRFRAVRLPHR
jgi:hypothetical protein